MRKQRSASRLTKRALATSVMAMLLCVVMLVGTTFAWFTDTVTSGVNTIIAGNLDVELDYYDTAAGDWKSVGADNDLFPLDTLWEPGHTEIVYLRIRNAGTLALRYAMLVTPVKETVGLNAAGDVITLSEYLDFGWADVNADENDALMPYDRTGARDAVTEWVKLGEALRNNDSDEALLPGASKCLALVVYMPETVGNEANYLTGTNAPTIELGVTLQATQKDSEDDSFGNDYDKDAEEEITIPKFNYDYSANENDGIIFVYDETGTTIVKAIVTKQAGKVPDGYFNDARFAQMTEVQILEGVTEIGDYAFNGCGALASVSMPESLTKIGIYAFNACSALTTASIPEGVTEIGEHTFNMCTAIKSLELPSTLKTVGYRAFHHLHALKSVNIPEGTVLEEGAFRASGLEEVTVNGGSIGTQAFYNCPNLKKVVINSEVIGAGAFAYDRKLTTLVLNEGLTTIGASAFQNCEGLKTLVIPSSVTSIGYHAFATCKAMTSATLKCKVTRADMFYSCLGLTTVVFSDDIKNIPGYMFGYSKQLTNVTVKAGTWKVNQKDYQTDANGKLPAAAVNFMIRNYGAAFVG